ncbi:putative epoxide hydrolase [Cyphellophora attinorum]|uniref:Putative epoxide hydrolase n=1 Tax=Cyphellophora attinorum TaxID=1664694 RepID=A0A0N1NWU0_9EURO|nr:putative epoxide hydrolase [Phialophora attinorum]KPI34365.1 putative epoxide hydrolase [Phialophora attinorum]
MAAKPFSLIPESARGEFIPFEVDVPASELDDLTLLIKRSRVNRTTFENTLVDGHLGVKREWLVEALSHWTDKFAWRKHETYINSFPAYHAKITDDDGRKYNIHFVGLFSKRKDAIPIFLLHGWPGSFLEFLPMLDILRNRYSEQDLPYHLIAPSMPGYAFSSPPPTDKDFYLSDIARLFNKLATESLGFRTYIVQGGDIGSKVGRVMAAEHKACQAVHMNFCIMPKPATLRPGAVISEQEQIGLKRADAFHRLGSAYALEHATKPSTIALVVGSNPVSLLAWIGEKFVDWTDETPDIDTILESISLYWFTDTFATTLYPYRHLFTPGVIGAHEDPKWYVHKPMGFSWFPKELAPIPRAWVETTGDLVFHREHQKGGHFAAVEQTETLLKDLEDFVAQVWRTGPA